MLAPTVMVMVELPAPGAGITIGLKVTVVPGGAPADMKTIAPLKPLLMVDVMIDRP